LTEAARLVSRKNGLAGEPTLVFQSRSGPPTQPWLAPDIGDWLRQTSSKRVIVVPIGFLSDHMEVVYDLDIEAAAIAKAQGIEMVRAGTAGVHPLFVAGLAQLINRLATEGVAECTPDCCPAPVRRP
jgi:ferrochelatase